MKVYVAKQHSDEDDDEPVSTGKLAMIYGTKKELLDLCDFFNSVQQHLNENENCHLHLRDHLSNWDKDNIDIEVNTE